MDRAGLDYRTDHLFPLHLENLAALVGPKNLVGQYYQ